MSSSVLCGQSALVGLPPTKKGSSSSATKKKSLQDCEVPPTMMVENRKLLKSSGEGAAGIAVYKVTKTGKLQPRRVAFSSDHRCLYITTNRVKLTSLKGLFKAATGNGTDPLSTKVIDISRVDRILPAQQLSRRFLLASREAAMVEAVSKSIIVNATTSTLPEHLLKDEKNCVTIVIRECNAEQSSSSTAASNFVEGLGAGAGVSSSSTTADNHHQHYYSTERSFLVTQGGFEFLDLIVPDPQDMANLVTVLQNLIKLYREERRWIERNALLLQYHLVDMGKKSDGTNASLTSNEWVELCHRLNAPLRKQEVSSLYRDMKGELRRMCKELTGNSHYSDLMDLDHGLPPWAVAELLHDLEFHSKTATGIRMVKQDPMLRLWYELLESDPVPDPNNNNKKSKSSNGSDKDQDSKISPTVSSETLSPIAFLSFVRSQQKDYKATLEDASALIKALQAQQSLKKIAEDSIDRSDDESENDGDSSNHNNVNVNNTDSSDSLDDSRLTMGQFFNFLLSDANDLMDPRKGKMGGDDMNHPLSHYWIMSSHDTYLNCMNGDQPTLDEQMYLAALYRGVRCLELDVWNGHVSSEHHGMPVIAREEPQSEDDRVLSLKIVLKSIRQFLQTNTKAYPVILNIENHCSYHVQQKMSDILFEILGSVGLIVVPDDSQSIDETDLLPSPASMRGKVLLMGKRPKNIAKGAKVINDDYDDENDVFADDSIPNVQSREEEHELEEGTVIGFDAKGPIRAMDEEEQNNIVKHSAGELLYIAKQELESTEMDAAETELKAVEAQEEAKTLDKYADSLIRNAGLSDEAVEELISQLRGVDMDPDEHVALLPRSQGEGVEVQDFLEDAVQSAKLTFTETDQVALKAAQKATAALQKLNQATSKLREAEELLEASLVKGKRVDDKFQRAARSARDKQEIANHATRRVEKLRQLLKECEDGANSAQNVVNTAMTEAKISEKRASETEARAARAASTAQKDRARAEEETRKEEELERQAATLHEQMIDAATKEKETKEKAEKAANMLGKLNEQIKLIEGSRQYQKEKQDMSEDAAEEKKENIRSSKGKLHGKLTSKVEERRAYTEALREATTEIKISSKRRKQAQEAFEDKAHQWKSVAETASRFRKASDKSSHTAEDLAEHAEEEREAANLRRVARDRAKSHVSEKGSYRTGLEAQLAEAERASKDAELESVKARKEADRLSEANDKFDQSDRDDILAVTAKRKATRDELLADYERKKKAKEEAEEKAAETKKVYETSDQVFSDAIRIARTDKQKFDVQRQQDKNALVAINNAKMAQRHAEHLLEQARYAQSIVTEKQCIVRRAEEYKEKTDRITEIPPNLAKMTFLHTTKHRYWDKSLLLPSTHVHSFAEGVLDHMAQKNGQEHTKNLKRFTASHLCRSFPSWKDFGTSSKLNSDPLFQWSLGCQLVSLNYGTFDEQLVKTDGRFRKNGSCGYALKPEFIRSTDTLQEKAESWKIQVMSGSYIPKPESGGASSASSSIHPRVKINVYGGDLEKRKGEHKTKIVVKNGLNPVFDDTDGFIFKATNPSLAILTFTVCNCTDGGLEEFIATAAMPVACLREGYRSIPLFDKQHSRTGAHQFASLFVKAQKVT
ncbi:MAG: hypothetical protein SGILL_000478 [Bacillariaceae sp.]